MTLPALRLARETLPDARMTVVVQDRYRGDLDFAGFRFETIPEVEGLSFWREVSAWRSIFRRDGYDAVVFHRLTRPDLAALLAAFLENIPHRVGGAEKGLQPLLTDLYFPAGRELVAHYHWNLVRSWLGLPLTAPELRWPPLVPNLVAGPKRWDLLIAPFAQHTKEWPAAAWHILLRAARHVPAKVALSASPAQADRAHELLADFPEVENRAAASMTLRQLFQDVLDSRCVLALDTGIRHVAAALGVPCVVLGHGREHLQLFGAYVPTERYLVHRVVCAPCGAEPCPLGHLECIRGTSPGNVAEAIGELVPGLNLAPLTAPSAGVPLTEQRAPAVPENTD